MLCLPATILATVTADCDRRRPDEACGLLIGTVIGETVRVVRATPVDNVWPDAAERPARYAVDPLTQARAESAAIAEGLSLVGFYHSHPHGPAVPSGFDLDRAWPSYIYLIVGFGETPGELINPTPRAWALDGGGAFREHSIETENP